MRTLAEVEAALPGLVDAPGLGWALAHCAQSVEYSLTGFPTRRGWLVRTLIGPRVLRRFIARGAMQHDTQAPIPGAAPIDPATSFTDGLARLRKALAAFAAHAGPLAPHFAYGAWSRTECEAAHALHLADHLRSLAGARPG